MSAPLGSIRNWSDVQLMEDVNDEDSVSAMKYNKCWRGGKACKKEVEWRACEEAEHHEAEEQWRVETERHRAKEQAKKCVSCFWLVMMELTVLGRGGYYITVWQGQGKGIRAAGVQLVCRVWA